MGLEFRHIVLSFLLVGICNSASVSHKSDVVRKAFFVDPRYFIQLDVDFDSEKIIVEVIVETTGYVGFGISPDGGMFGADIFVGSINDKGESQFNNYHGFHAELIPRDVITWDSCGGEQNSTHTHLKFGRSFITGDGPQDVPIKDGPTHIIWSMGRNGMDNPHYHGPNRGSYPINILARD